MMKKLMNAKNIDFDEHEKFDDFLKMKNVNEL